MSRYVMGVVTANGQDDIFLDENMNPTVFVKHLDVNAHDGRGEVEVTTEIGQARRWETSIDVFNAWREIPAARPYRDDGKTNRPGTSMTIEPVKVEE